MRVTKNGGMVNLILRQFFITKFIKLKNIISILKIYAWNDNFIIFNAYISNSRKCAQNFRRLKRSRKENNRLKYLGPVVFAQFPNSKQNMHLTQYLKTQGSV